VARRRGSYRRRSRSRGSSSGTGLLLAIIVVFVVLVAIAAQNDDVDGDGNTSPERREAEQDAEARAGADDGETADDGNDTTQERNDAAEEAEARAGEGGSDEAGGVAGGGASDGRTATELLAVLVVTDEGSRDGYEREAFGDGWDVDADGCDTREVVLAEESTAPVVRREDCSVARGRWSSLYDGEVTRDTGDLEIDHMVPLAEAWESGAAAWTHERRELFANDLRRQGALVAVTASTNESKSDQDPAEWMPPEHDAWCVYARAWIVEKHAWRLTIDPAEHATLEDVLADC